MKPAAVFGIVALLHFVLSVAGTVLALRAAFDAKPVEVILTWTAAVLLSPLSLLSRGDFGYLEIVAVSVLFGLAAVLVTYAAGRARRAGRRPAG